MKIVFSEQDLIDAACVFVANTYREPIDRLTAELRYDESEGIRGTVESGAERRIYDLSEQDLIDGAAMYLSQYHALFDPQRLKVELQFNEGEGMQAVAESW